MNGTKMSRRHSAFARTLFVSVATMVLCAASYGGEALSERDETDNGPSFFGEAKEVGTLKPVPKVLVKAELGARRISTYSSAEGHFKIPSFGKETVADSVVVTCAKDGYRTVDVARRAMSAAADAAIEIECLLDPGK
jgi:hypothetical protein